MATYNGQTYADEILPQGGIRLDFVAGQLVDLGATTTYYFRRTDGTRGSATSLGSIPAGAVIERIATT